MLTNTGKNILAKYLIGQAPAYASYIAFGCGPKAINVDTGSFSDYSNKNSLDFEMFRAPIISRGYVTDIDQANITNVSANGTLITYTANNNFVAGDIVDIVGTNVANFNITNAVVASATSVQFTIASNKTGTYLSGGTATRTTSNIVFTAQLPTEERYEITEIGVYSAGSNPSAGPADSRMLYFFSDNENWEYHQASGARTLTKYTQPLSKLADGTAPDGASPEAINVPDLVFQANADNTVFDSLIRLSRNERSRFLNNTVILRGDSSSLIGDDSSISVSPNDGAHIHLNGITLNLDKNSGQDEIRVAFSVINKENDSSNPTDVKLVIDFVSSDDLNAINQQYARFKTHVKLTQDSLATNRYFVKTMKLEDLEKSQEFSWRNVSAVKAYVSIPAEYRAVSTKKVESNVATLTFVATHDFGVGGRISVTNTGSPFDGTHTITAITDTSVSYAVTSPDIASTPGEPTARVDGYSSNFYVGLDAIRIENVSTINPLYGLVGYTIAKTSDGLPIIKESNTSSLLEFRFAMDVM